MEQSSKLKNLSPLVFVVVAAAVGWGIGYWQASNTLKERFAEYQIPLIANSKSVSGTIERVDGKTVYIRLFSSGPFEKARTIAATITPSTVIEKLEPKSEKLLSEEMKSFAEGANASSGELRMQPDPFMHSTMSVTDLVVGQSVSVVTAEEVAKTSRVTAVSILITVPLPGIMAPPSE